MSGPSHILVGGGAFARELHDWFTPALEAAGDGFLGYLDDGEDPLRGSGHGLKQLGRTTDFAPAPGHHLVMAVADPAAKRLLAARLGPDRFTTLIHPTAWRSRSARVGRGTVVGVFADLSADCQLGEFTTVNGYGSVGHDAVLGDYATLSGYVDLTGGARVGEGCFLGSGARLLPGVSLGSGCTVGAGAVVVRSVEGGVTLFAAPARRLSPAVEEPR